MHFPGEKEAVRAACDIGSKFGYGNLIDRLMMAWAISLIEIYEMEFRAACRAAGFVGERVDQIEKAGLEAMKKYVFQETATSTS